MYNRYISNGQGEDNFVPASALSFDFQQPFSFPSAKEAAPEPKEEEHPAAVQTSGKSLLGNLFGKKDGKTGLLGGLFDGLQSIDIGDIVLILIFILLLMEGDDTDFLITLALVFLLGF